MDTLRGIYYIQRLKLHVHEELQHAVQYYVQHSRSPFQSQYVLRSSPPPVFLSYSSCFEYRREERAPIHLKKGVDPQAHYHRKVQRCKRVEVKIDNQSKLLLPMTPCAPLLLAPPKIGAIPIATFNLNPFYTADKLSSVAQLLESLRGNCHP